LKVEVEGGDKREPFSNKEKQICSFRRLYTPHP
jgi:hypothetical protein